MMNKQDWTVEVQQMEDSDDLFIELNEEMLEFSGFKEGDTIKWIDNQDGSFTLVKK
jgi:hypothetical protein